jgi:hypothetical protein
MAAACFLAATSFCGTGAAQPRSGPTSVGPSFDCAKASTVTERAICGSPALADLDVRVSAAYKKARALASPYLKAAVHADQLAYLEALGAIGSSEQRLQIAMRDRVGSLTALAGEYEHPREEQVGPFRIRYVRAPHWDILVPTIVSAPPGAGSAKIASRLRAALNDGCDGMPETGDSAEFRLHSTVLYADTVFFTVTEDTYYFCGGAHPSSSNGAHTYLVSTGEPLTASSTFTPRLTIEQVLRLAKQHDKSFTTLEGPCLEALAIGDGSLKRPFDGSIAVVKDTVVFSPTFPGAVRACGFSTSVPRSVLSSFVLPSGPLGRLAAGT